MRLQLVSAVLILALTYTSSLAGLKFQFDYQYDSLGFFDRASRREAMEGVGRIVNKYVDNLAAIEPTETNKWTTFISKPDGSGDIFVSDLPVPQDTAIVYVAGRPLPGRLAQAIDFAGLGSGTPEFNDAVLYRGQVGASQRPATDFGLMGGTISFNSNLNEVPWHFGLGTQLLDNDEFDFLTVASHEVLHLLGIGVSKSFRDQTNASGQFIGDNAVVAGSSTNPTLQLDDSESHWQRGTKSSWNGNVQEALLAPAIAPGQRQFPTLLDRAAVRDIGWEEGKPGDANLDRVFNSSDLVTVFVAGKYETPDLAGWSDGDFNDDALFGSSDLVVALAQGMYSEAAVAEAAAVDPTASIEGQVLLRYDSRTGNLNLLTDSEFLSTIEIRSTGSLFQQEFAAGFDGPFDVHRSDKLFKLDPAGFGDSDLGNVLPIGLASDLLMGDLSIDGSFASGGRLTDVRIEMVPEPSSAAIAVAGLLLTLAIRRSLRRIADRSCARRIS